MAIPIVPLLPGVACLEAEGSHAASACKLKVLLLSGWFYHHYFVLSLPLDMDKDSAAVKRADKDKEMSFPSWDYGGNHERGVLSLQHRQTTQTAVFFCLPEHADKY